MQDVKELSLLILGTHRLQKRFEEEGPRLLKWMPSTIRHLLHVRLVGSLFPFDASDSNVQQDAVVRALVLLELFDRVSDVVSGLNLKRSRGRPVGAPSSLAGQTSPPASHSQTRSPGQHAELPSPSTTRSPSESTEMRVIRGELTRIRVSAEDMKELLEEELEQIRSAPLSSAVLSPALNLPHTPFEQVFAKPGFRRTLSNDVVEGSKRTPISAGVDADDDDAKSVTSISTTSSYAHPLLDKSIPAAPAARHAPRPDLIFEHQTLVAALRSRARRRTSTFPLALGLLVQCIVRGTLPARPGKNCEMMRKRTASDGGDVKA